MKVPKRIENLIIKCAKQNEIANQAQKEIEDWLVTQGINIEDTSFRDVFLDSVVICYSPGLYIEYLKKIEGWSGFEEI